jgi:hypothetical protein
MSITAEYLRGLKLQTEKERRENPLDFKVKKYRDMILNTAMKGGHRYEIIDISEEQVPIVHEKLKEIFVDLEIEINEYFSPVCPDKLKSIILKW